MQSSPKTLYMIEDGKQPSAQI